jgi:mycothiol synthase
LKPHELSSSQFTEAKISNLRMEYRRFPELPAARAVEGYELRTFRAGDESAWLAILSASDLGEWDRARIDRLIAGERGHLPLDGAFFATFRGEPVATAHAEMRDGGCSELSWVAVLPEHRGRNLAYPLCRAVLAYAQSAGHPYVILKTQDFRISAIKTYLRLGFEPKMEDPTHRQRWSELREFLASSGSTRVAPSGRR